MVMVINTSRIGLGFPSMFTSIVAEAVMQLPPLTQPEHFAFLEEMQAMVVEGFWSNYVASCPQNIQKELVDALEHKNVEASEQWFETYAAFKTDSNAAARAEKALNEIAAALPALMKEVYDQAFATKS